MSAHVYCSVCGTKCKANLVSCTVCGNNLPSASRKNPMNSASFRSQSMVVFDIDDTILDVSQRYKDARRAGYIDKDGNAKRKRTLETPGKARKRANDFLFSPENLAKDRVVPGALALANDLAAKGHIIAYVTARHSDYRDVTRNQLEAKGFPLFKDDTDMELLFLKASRGEATPKYKNDAYAQLNSRYDVRMVFDDRKDNLEQAASQGITGLYPSVSDYTRYQVKSNPWYSHSDGAAYFYPDQDSLKYGGTGDMDPDAEPYDSAESHSDESGMGRVPLTNPPVKPRRKKMKNGKYRKEPAKKYVDRFMGDSKMNKEFPDRGQRYAVCLRYVEKFYGKSGLKSVGARPNPPLNCGCGRTPCMTYGARSNPEEYSEDYMVPRDIHRLGKAADSLESTYDEQDVPEWWKSKLSVTAKDADTLADSLDYVAENPMPLMGLSVQVSGYRNAAGAFVMKGKKFLILQRSKKETSKHGLWELPGGKVEEGETPRQTAVIETKEEAGLDIKLKANLGPHHDDKKKKTYHAYVGVAKKGQKVKLSEEHSAHKWVTPEEVLAMPKKMVSHHLLYFLKKEGETIRSNPFGLFKRTPKTSQKVSIPLPEPTKPSASTERKIIAYFNGFKRAAESRAEDSASTWDSSLRKWVDDKKEYQRLIEEEYDDYFSFTIPAEMQFGKHHRNSGMTFNEPMHYPDDKVVLDMYQVLKEVGYMPTSKINGKTITWSRFLKDAPHFVDSYLDFDNSTDGHPRIEVDDEGYIKLLGYLRYLQEAGKIDGAFERGMFYFHFAPRSNPRSNPFFNKKTWTYTDNLGTIATVTTGKVPTVAGAPENAMVVKEKTRFIIEYRGANRPTEASIVLPDGSVESQKGVIHSVGIYPKEKPPVAEINQVNDSGYYDYLVSKGHEAETEEEREDYFTQAKLVNESQWDDILGGETPDEIMKRLGPKNNPRSNPPKKKIEKGKKLYEHMNGKAPEKIEKKKIDMGDVWYQVGEGGCWQIGYMSGKETGKSEQKYTHTFNEETKDGNFPKLYATMPENGKPLLIIQGGTWKIRTDDKGVAWIYD